jgi:AraC-like DNA-binding protein
MNLESKLYLWKKRTLYLGHIDKPIRLIQPAPSIAFGLDKPIKLAWAERTIRTRSFLLPPSTLIQGDSEGGAVAICMLDPLGYDYASMSKLMKNRSDIVLFDIRNEEEYLSSFKHLYTNKLEASEVYPKLSDLLKGGGNDELLVDPRMHRVLELIHQNVRENISIDLIAKDIGVSTSRLFQLFKEQIGAPIRRYRLWHRLFCASCVLANTFDLTEAALSAGFSDVAHFHRTFKRMLGMTPVDLLSQQNGLRIYTEIKV